MDLKVSPEHEAFRAGIRAFIAQHGHEAVALLPGERPEPAHLAWQALLLEHGYAGRFVPREYGGYGAAPDVMQQQLIVEEFGRFRSALLVQAHCLRSHVLRQSRACAPPRGLVAGLAGGGAGGRVSDTRRMHAII